MPTLPIDTRRINTHFFSFAPDRTERSYGTWPNPYDDFTGDNFAARLFIGFNVGNKPTWNIDTIMTAVFDIREKQGAAPDATYLATKGVFTHGSGHVVVEDGCQVIIFDTGEGEKFKSNILQLAEKLTVLLEQEAIFVEIQKNGVQVGLFRARP